MARTYKIKRNQNLRRTKKPEQIFRKKGGVKLTGKIREVVPIPTKSVSIIEGRTTRRGRRSSGSSRRRIRGGERISACDFEARRIMQPRCRWCHMYVHNNSIYSRSFEREGGLFSRGYVRVDVIGIVILILKPMTMTMTWRLLLLLLLLLSESWMSSVIDR